MTGTVMPRQEMLVRLVGKEQMGWKAVSVLWTVPSGRVTKWACGSYEKRMFSHPHYMCCYWGRAWEKGKCIHAIATRETQYATETRQKTTTCRRACITELVQSFIQSFNQHKLQTVCKGSSTWLWMRHRTPNAGALPGQVLPWVGAAPQRIGGGWEGCAGSQPAPHPPQPSSPTGHATYTFNVPRLTTTPGDNSLNSH